MPLLVVEGGKEKGKSLSCDFGLSCLEIRKFATFQAAQSIQ